MTAPSAIRHIHVCNLCGSDQVTRDAWAIWDVERQDWVLDTLFDHVYCHQCLDHSRLDRVPLIVPAVRPPEGGV